MTTPAEPAEPPESAPATPSPERTADASEPAAPRAWTGERRGGQLGNLFFAVLIKSPLWFLTPFFLFWVACYFVVAAPAARRASFDLADRVGRGGSTWRRTRFAFWHFYTFGMTLIDQMALLGGQEGRYRFTHHGEELIREAIERGRGAILVTGHLGNWEVMGHLLSRVGARVTVVMYDGVQPELRRTMERLAAARSFRVLFTDGSPTAAAGILGALERGEVVGMMGDRVLGSRGVAVTLLGHEAQLPVGPYVVASLSEAPLLHVFAIRTGSRRYALHAFEAEPPRRARAAERQQELARCARAYALRLEGFLREHPEQWGNFYPFWGA